ncbi:hypothetical protein [Pseudomonas nabeulensis]|uniref:hypothetical protein n=1 Tax=Pseudomonas nabeulensis TaxID=2293833 RepID=UPI001EE987DD|nr:hypothetical protein [Pseudomonas nabeulensis]
MRRPNRSAGFKRFLQLETLADPGKKLTVSRTAGSQGKGVYYNCGPVMNTFSPEKAKVCGGVSVQG